MPTTLKSIKNNDDDDYEGTFSNVLSIDMWIWVSVLASGVFIFVLVIWSLSTINKRCRKKYRLTSVISPTNESRRMNCSRPSLPYNQTAV